MHDAPVDENQSCWVAELPAWQPGPALQGDRTVDVAIIGGGITGVSTAWHLARLQPGLGVALLEARTLGNGATGRSGGQVLNGINGIEPDDPESARRIRAATMQGIGIVEKLAAESTIDTGFHRGGCTEVVTSSRGAEAAQRRVEQAAAWGIPLRWIDGPATGLRGATGAVLDPDAGGVNPAALVRGLRERLAALGVAVLEQTPVLRVRQGRTVELETQQGRVRASAVVLATNAWTPSLGFFRNQVLPLHSRVVATAPLAADQWSRLGHLSRGGFADDLDRIAYGCRTPGGRLLFGGGSNSAYEYRPGGSPLPPEPTGARFAGIEASVERYFPGLASRIAMRWSGPLAITFDRVCSMGVGGPYGNVYHALGYSGHGLALGALAGKVLADLHRGNHDDWRGLPFYQRRMPWIPPEPFRWVGYKAFTLLTGRSPRRH